ncbi:hypothetical protein [Solihabitans fulvus]|nr:hypothetical protein [Solihabitans fulvus]
MATATLTENPATATTSLLRLVLRADAVVTGVNGLAYLALAGPLETLLGPAASVQEPIGVFLLVYGVAVWFAARPAKISRTVTKLIMGANALWAIVSLMELAPNGLPFTTVGAVWDVLQAIVVGGFCALQYVGLRRSR